MEFGRHEADGPPDGEGFDAVAYEAEPAEAESAEAGQGHTAEGTPRRERKHRRVSTKAVPGSDPNPQPEPPRHSGTENDDRLKADKPPHWG